MQRKIALDTDQLFNVWAAARDNGRASGEDVDQWDADEMMWQMDCVAAAMFGVHDLVDANRAEIDSALTGSRFFLDA